MAAPQSIFSGAEVISAYTRAQAIEDGVLVDLMQDGFHGMVAEAGFKFPAAITSAAFHQTVCPLDADLPDGQDMGGRLWDILTVLRGALRFQLPCRRPNPYTVIFKLHVVPNSGGRPQPVELKAVTGPGDAGEPVLTIMLPDED